MDDVEDFEDIEEPSSMSVVACRSLCLSLSFCLSLSSRRWAEFPDHHRGLIFGGLVFLCSVTRSAESGGYDELENFPNKVEIFTASVEGNLSDPSYIMK